MYITNVNFEMKQTYLILIVSFMCSVIQSSYQETNVTARQEVLEQGREVVANFYQRYSTKQVDLIFVIDRSASVKRLGWSSMINFVRSLLEHFTVDGENTRVAIVTFSTVASVDLNDLAKNDENKCSLIKRIQNRLQNKQLSGYTATHDALVATRNLLYNSRRSAKKAVFVLTDGRSNIGPPPVRASVDMRSLRWNSTWNYTLFGPQLEIYAFGIQNTDISELRSIASPLPNHTYHIPNFVMFKELARSLHKDKQTGKWDILPDGSRCPKCSVHAYCTCATKTGDYQCVCKEGYEGNGQECTKCSVGYYKDRITPERCRKCHGNTTTAFSGAKHAGYCKCIPPYHQEQEGHPCQLKKCPDLPNIPHGKTVHIRGRVTDEQVDVNIPCDNTPGNSCHYTCEEGYRLTGHPALVCEVNGTWLGDIPECHVIDCRSLAYHNQVDTHSRIHYLNRSTTYGSMIEINCESGYKAYGDTTRVCTRHGLWSGTRTWCIESRCPELPLVTSGQILPKSCTQNRQRVGQICEHRCNHGYQLAGPIRKVCQEDGTWNNNTDVTCTDVEAPYILCPGDIRAPVMEGNFSVVHWDIEKPKVEDNSGLVSVRVIGYEQSPYRLTKGYHQITYIAEDSAGNTASCTRGILIVEKIVRVTNCPDDINITEVFGYAQEVTWPDPEFQDNHNQTLPFQCTKQSGSLFTVGLFIVHCTTVEPSDAFCQFKVELHKKMCHKPAPPIHGSLSCIPAPPSFLEICMVHCNDMYDFFDFPQSQYKCKLDGEWELQYPNKFWPDCSLEHYPGMAMVEGEYEYFYYHGECELIKHQIIDMFRRRLEQFSWQICGAASCSVKEIQVRCGLEARRKRSADDTFENTTEYTVTNSSNNLDLGTENSSPNFGNLTSNTSQETLIKKYLKMKFKVNISTNGNTKLDHRNILLVFRNMRIRLQRHLQRENMTFNINSGGISVPVVVAMETRTRSDLQFTFERCPSGYILKQYSIYKLCVQCPAGTYFTDLNGTQTCTTCPAGMYQDTAGSLNCLPCPTGYTTSGIEARNRLQCKALCPPGYFSLTRVQPCSPCPVGFYQNNTGSLSCLPCPPNTRSISGHAESIDDCKALCLPGSYNEQGGLDPCITCPLSTYQPLDGASECLLCPDNSTTLSNGSVSVTDCIEINVCQNVGSDVCKNGGTCLSERNDYSCLCLPGFHGDHCEFETNECQSFPCKNNGTCIDGLADFTCNCLSSFTGKTCNVEVNECDFNPCQNGGSCEDLWDGYKCYCPYTHKGVNCQHERYCSQHHCHHGNCQEDDTGYQCTCNIGYKGENCDVLDYCWYNPCHNSGTCINRRNDFECLCENGYTGKMCEYIEPVVSPCKNNPCQNNGQCNVIEDQFYCKCQSGYGGIHCEQADFDLLFDEPSITDYVRLRFVDIDITAITACMWLRTSDIRNYGTPFSYAAETNYITAEESDMFTLNDYGGLQVFVNGETATTGVSVNNGKWNHVCVSWQSLGGKWWLYINGTVAERGENLANNAVIPGKGFFIIGQEQDIVGDGFNSRESYIGEISQLNVYNHVMSSVEILQLANQTKCNMSLGNIIGWTDVIGRLKGNVVIRKNSYCLDINECEQTDVSPCPLNKKCKDLIGGYNCSVCVYGYQGHDCDVPINECHLNVCHNNGSCVDGPFPNDYKCHCSSSFTGINCESTLNPCDEDPCLNNGTCVLHRDGYACLCTDPGMMDRNCNYLGTPCQSNPCQNLGSCLVKNNTFECSCTAGFKGKFCDIRVNSCYDNLCQNGGSCISTSYNSYVCRCPISWKGTHCEVAYVSGCEQTPCLNNGTCIPLLNGYQCVCPKIAGYQWGPNCEQDACESSPCLNNGMCLNLYNNRYKCICDEEFTGLNCQWNVTDLWMKNEMTTMDSLNDDKSTETTQSEIDLCSHLLCRNGGTCFSRNSQVYCHCAPGFTGEFCMELRKSEMKEYTATVLLNLPFDHVYQEGKLFKRDFRNQVRQAYNRTIKDGRLQVTDIFVRPGKDNSGTLVSYKCAYIEFTDTTEPPVTMDALRNVMEKCVQDGYLGRFTVSQTDFVFKPLTDSFRGKNVDDSSDDGGSTNSVTVYLILTLIVLLVILLVVGILIMFRLRRTSYRKTTKLLQGLNNTSTNALNLISNPVFEDMRERTPSSEDNMYAELAEMLDPYCVTPKSDIYDDDVHRNPVSRYSSTRSVRSNKDSNLQWAVARKCSELSDSPKKLNSPSGSLNSENFAIYLSPLSKKNEFDFTNMLKKDTKELLPAMLSKNNSALDQCGYYNQKDQNKECKDNVQVTEVKNQQRGPSYMNSEKMDANCLKTSEAIPEIKVVLDNSSLTMDSDKKINRLSDQSGNSITELMSYHSDDQSSVQHANEKCNNRDKMAKRLSTESNQSGMDSVSVHTANMSVHLPCQYANGNLQDVECNKVVNRLSIDSDSSGTALMSTCTTDIRNPSFHQYSNGGFETGDSGRMVSTLDANLISGQTTGVKRPSSLHYANDSSKADVSFLNKNDQHTGNCHRNIIADKYADIEIASETTIKDSLTKLVQAEDSEKVTSNEITLQKNICKERESKSLEQEEKDKSNPTNQIPPYINCMDRNAKAPNESQSITYDYAEPVETVKTKPECEIPNVNKKLRRPLPDPENPNSSFVSKEKKKACNFPELSKEVKPDKRCRVGTVENDDCYVLPNSSDEKKVKKTSPLKFESDADYMDMSGKKGEKGSMKKDDSSCEEIKRMRHRSADDYLEVLPPKPEDLPSTLPRAAKHKDVSKRKLPPLPKYSPK